jgi:hypothetical protein
MARASEERNRKQILLRKKQNKNKVAMNEYELQLNKPKQAV